MWVDLRTALSNNERQVILEEVARGESAAEEAYDDALRQNLPSDALQTVKQQHRRVRETRNRYRAMAGSGQSTSMTGQLAHQISSGAGSMSNHMQERPLMSSFAVFAIGFLAGALAVSMMSGEESYGRSNHRHWR
jgi:hypothetical protein